MSPFISEKTLGAWIYVGTSVLLLRPLMCFSVFASQDMSGQSGLILMIPVAATSAPFATSVAFLLLKNDWLWRAAQSIAALITIAALIFANYSLAY
jgi:hypothetical protein